MACQPNLACAGPLAVGPGPIEAVARWCRSGWALGNKSILVP